jgi:hypothetical protein
MYTREKTMSLKIGDKVKMTKKGFRFYGNIEIVFDMNQIDETMSYEHFKSALCEAKAIHGIGTVKKFNSLGEPYVRWENSLDGIYYFYTHYFCTEDVRKLNFFDRLKAKLKSLL